MSDELPPKPKPEKVGPGHPPKEYRFKRGAPSPNPLGRPPKPKKEDSLFRTLDPWAADIMKFDSAKFPGVGERGEPIEITRREKMIQKLYVRAMGDKPDHKAAKLLFDMSTAAHAANKDYRMHMLAAALAHRAKYLATFKRYEAAGKPLPGVYPDPRDVIIRPDGSVTVHGPSNGEERKAQNILLQHQQDQIEAIRRIGPYKAGDCNAAVKKFERKLKRQLARTNQALSPRLRRIFTEDDIDEDPGQAG